MGLDMYVFTTSRSSITGNVDFDIDKIHRGFMVQCHYWRKHPDLHGWMQQLYFKKGGKDPEFNWAGVSLDRADLDVLKEVIKTDCLPKTTGFFFGESDGSEKWGDLAFIMKARLVLTCGGGLFYVASW